MALYAKWAELQDQPAASLPEGVNAKGVVASQPKKKSVLDLEDSEDDDKEIEISG